MKRLAILKEAARLTCLGRELGNPWLVCIHEEEGEIAKFSMWPRNADSDDWTLSFTLGQVEGTEIVEEGVRPEFGILLAWLGEEVEGG